jgi:hypothetical protein
MLPSWCPGGGWSVVVGTPGRQAMTAPVFVSVAMFAALVIALVEKAI